MIFESIQTIATTQRHTKQNIQAGIYKTTAITAHHTVTKATTAKAKVIITETRKYY